MSELIKNTKDLLRLPRVEDSISYVYIEHSLIEQDNFAIVSIDKEGKIPIPIANICCLMLGPGTKISHAAIKTISQCGCLIVWCGENIRKFYAYGMGENRSSKNLQKQIALWYKNRLDVIKRMYQLRFPDLDMSGMSLEQMRGLEGIRIKQTYKSASKIYGVSWYGRKYKIEDINDTDDANRAITIANDLLYSVCEAVIVSLGYSPAIGFIHTGLMRSFVYDVADFYKTQIAIPSAFEAVACSAINLDKTVRENCRKRFVQLKLLKRIQEDINTVFNTSVELCL